LRLDNVIGVVQKWHFGFLFLLLRLIKVADQASVCQIAANDTQVVT